MKASFTTFPIQNDTTRCTLAFRNRVKNINKKSLLHQTQIWKILHSYFNFLEWKQKTIERKSCAFFDMISFHLHIWMLSFSFFMDKAYSCIQTFYIHYIYFYSKCALKIKNRLLVLHDKFMAYIHEMRIKSEWHINWVKWMNRWTIWKIEGRTTTTMTTTTKKNLYLVEYSLATVAAR